MSGARRRVQSFPLKFDARETNGPNDLALVSLWRGEESNHADIDRSKAVIGFVCLSSGWNCLRA
jgi:hypothetical protein